MKDDQDYSLVSMLERMKRAKGRPLTLEERARLVEMASEIERTEIELAASETKLQNEIEKQNRNLELETREDLEEELAKVKSELLLVKFEMLRASYPDTSLTPELVNRIEQLAENETYIGLAQ